MSEQPFLFDPATHRWPEPEAIRTKSGWEVLLRRVLVQSREALYAMRDVLYYAREISYDTETSGLHPHLGARIIGHAFATATKQDEITAWYTPIRHIGPDNEHQVQLDPAETAAVVAQILGVPQSRCWFTHAKFDWLHALYDGIVCKRDYEDVSILATINDENEPSFGLKPLMEKYAFDGAKTGLNAVEEWMRADARHLKIPYKKRKRGEVEEVDALGEPTYLERFGHSRVPIPLEGRYSCDDVFGTLYLGLVKFAKVPEQHPAVHAREKRVSRILHKMEFRGLLADVQTIHAAHTKTGDEVLYWLSECRRLAGDSSFTVTDDEVRTLLYEKLKMEVPKRTDGEKPSVDRESRQLLEHKYSGYVPLLRAIDALQVARKLHGTYSGNFLRFVSAEGRIHPSYNQLEEREEGGVPVTGRLSSSDPNAQNIASTYYHLHGCRCGGTGKLGKDKCPGDPGQVISIRSYFVVAPDRVRAYLDFNQVELRMLAFFSQDPTLLRAYANDEDVHGLIAKEIGCDRKVAKQINFGNSFGMTEIGLARRMPGYYEHPEETREEATRVLEAYFRRYKGIPAFRKSFAEKMRRNGNSFVNPFGRPRRIEDISAYERWKRERAERMMMSSIISGTAADIAKESMIRIDDILEEEQAGEIVQCIHDEIVVDLVRRPGWTKTLVRCAKVMEDWPFFEERGVPIRVNVELSVTSWEGKKPIVLNPDGTFAWKK